MGALQRKPQKSPIKKKRLTYEVMARFVFSDEATIKRLATEHRSIAKRLLWWIQDKIKLLKTPKTDGERAVLKRMQEAERLYVKALENAHGIADAMKAAEAGARYALKDSVKTLDGYTEAERKSILADKRNLIAERYEDIVDFIKSASPKSVAQNLHIGKIKEELTTKIREGAGLEPLGYSVVLNSNNVYHIFKKHGNAETEILRGQIPVTVVNALDVVDTILTPDNVRSETDAGETSIIFEKVIDGKTTAVTILSNKKTRLTLKSAWINSKRGASTVGKMPANASNPSTSETERSIASINNIPQPAAKVNPSEENDSQPSKKRFSLPATDSKGRTLTAEQREFFADSEVVDDEGRLLPVYHVTSNDFTVFLKKYSGMNTDDNASSKGYIRTAHLGFWFNEKAINDNRSDKIDDKGADIEGKSEAEVAQYLYELLNLKTEKSRGTAALKAADMMIYGAVIDDVYRAEGAREDIFILKTLKKYLHKVNLNADGMKADIKAKYDTLAGSKRARWEAKKNGLSMPNIAIELESEGVRLNSDNEYDMFLELVDLYDSARDSLKAKAAERRTRSFRRGKRGNARRQKREERGSGGYERKIAVDCKKGTQPRTRVV